MASRQGSERLDVSTNVSLADFDSIRDDQALNVAEVEDIPPNGGYGWVCTFCVFLINCNSWGVNAAWSVFLARYLADSTFPGATHLHYGIIGGLSISMALIISPVITFCNSKCHPRVAMLLGTVMIFGALLGSSFATEIWHLFLTQGALFGFGVGFLYITASAVLPQWFSTKRSLSLGIAGSGTGFGGLAYSLGASAAVGRLGLARTYQVLAITATVCNIVCALILKPRKARMTPAPGTRAIDPKDFGHLSVWLIIMWGVLTELGYVILLYSLPTYAESLGLSIQQGSIIGAMLNLGLAVGRPVVGQASDRYGRLTVASIMTAICGVLCLALWVPVHGFAGLCVFALLAGTVTGTFWGCVVPVTIECVGLTRMPGVLALILLPMVLPATFAEAVAVQMTSQNGYLATQFFTGAVFLVAAMSVWFLRAWKINEIEQKAVSERMSAVEAAMAPYRKFAPFKLQHLVQLQRI